MYCRERHNQEVNSEEHLQQASTGSEQTVKVEIYMHLLHGLPILCHSLSCSTMYPKLSDNFRTACIHMTESKVGAWKQDKSAEVLEGICVGPCALESKGQLAALSG